MLCVILIEYNNIKEFMTTKITTSRRATLSLLIFQLMLFTNQAFGQDEAFEMIADSQIVHLSLDYGGDHLGVRISKLPAKLIGSLLFVQNISKSCSGGAEIVGRQFSLELRGDYRRTDTLIISVVSRGDRKLQYPAEVYIRNNMKGQIIIGADCYELNCVPWNDPWMPTTYDPFLFPKYGHYINPKNGKIKNGRRLIKSGYYDVCDLKHWKYISPFGLYYDKNGIKHRGSDLITEGKIKLSDWNLDIFHLFFFL
jgi:hypothetical protein